MHLPNPSNVPNINLLSEIKALHGTENSVLADIILRLHEIDIRGIYRDEGYSSLFTYCTEGLGYSEGGAMRRIRAARCLSTSPEIYELVRIGKLTLCAISEVSTVMTAENKAEVLKQTEGASKREAERIKVLFGGPVAPKQERITPKIVVQSPVAVEVSSAPEGEERFNFSFDVKKEVRELFEEAKAIAGHVPIAEIFEKALRAYVQKHKPQRESKRTSFQSSSASRYVSKSVRRVVVQRDGGRCTYVSPEGKRCSERCGLQLDHIQPFATGGLSTAENLRLLCPAHNQLCAEKHFGKEFMKQKRTESFSDAFSERATPQLLL